MKDFVKILNQVANRRYSNATELNDMSNNRLKKSDIDRSTFEANFAECEELNTKFEEIDFNNRKNAIINRLFERRRQGQFARQPKCLFILLMLGFFSLLGGFFIIFARPYDFLFRQKVVLQDGGEIFDMWRKPEVPLYCKVYLFNVTNAEEYMAGNATKLQLKEVGPYVYREKLEHDIQGFNENSTLSAIPRHPLTWIEELSMGNKEDDVLFLPHIALLSIANVVSKQSLFTRFGLNNLIRLTDSQPLAKMTAREFMMGYKSELMTLGNTFLPGWIYFDKLGLIDRMYDFNGDYETIFTGADDVRKSGLIDTYRGSTDLPQWDGKYCSNVQNASDGTKFRGGVEPDEEILFYRKSLCRAAPLIPTEVGVKSGLTAYKYTFPAHMLDNGKFNEQNKCFCRHGNCLPEGLIDVTECYYGFPIALSYPHFYQGDEVLFSKVEGLTPNKEQHETRFWIQPDSGLPIDVSSKFQINMALGDISMIEHTKLFSNMYLPLLWFDITMSDLPEPMQQRFKMYLNILPIVEQGIMYVCFVAGSIIILATIYVLTFKIMFKNYQQRHLDICKTKNQKSIYSPCEITIDTDSDECSKKETKTLIGDKLKDLSVKLTDKMYDTVGSVKKVTEMNIKNVFERKASLKNLPLNTTNNSVDTNDSRNDSGDDYDYREVRQSDSDEECKYLEVVDDGNDFYQNFESSKKTDHDIVLHIAD